jgi:hypothetical protein
MSVWTHGLHLTDSTDCYHRHHSIEDWGDISSAT